MLDTLILILTLLLKAASLWFLAVALFALRKPKRYAVCAPRTRFACLVAARNEEAVIGALVESLKKQDYPDALYDIFVIPNNCTDDTESEALCAGAKIFRCFVPGALTYDEAPNDFAVSLRQRRRWCSGIMDVAVRMDAPLVSALRGSAPLRALDALLIVNAPFLQALTLLPLTLTILSSLVQGTAGTLALTGAVSLTLSTLGLMALAALLAYLGGYRDRRIVRTVAGFPFFMAAWLPLQLVSLVSRTRSWQPIAHTRAVRAENLHDAGFLTTI